jgi:hypothetical protein
LPTRIDRFALVGAKRSIGFGSRFKVGAAGAQFRVTHSGL